MTAHMLPAEVVRRLAADSGYCTDAIRFAGVTITCDKRVDHEGKHGGVYPADGDARDVAVSW